jgi:hypothetical protein
MAIPLFSASYFDLGDNLALGISGLTWTSAVNFKADIAPQIPGFKN